jgi:hypothetical protein
VRVRDRDQLLELAKEFYSDLARDEGSDIGGQNLLLSCSLERMPLLGSEHLEAAEVTSPCPEVLGMGSVKPGTRPNELIDAVRIGRLKMEEMVGEPSELAKTSPVNGGLSPDTPALLTDRYTYARPLL